MPISYTTASYNPIVGCRAIREGCAQCYAARDAWTRLSRVPIYQDMAPGGHWTGEVRLQSDYVFDMPLRVKRPRVLFVCSTSDLFYEGVQRNAVDRVWATMALAVQHRFLVLTKRPRAMREYLTDPELPWRLEQAATTRRQVLPTRHPSRLLQAKEIVKLPLPNVYLGTSVCMGKDVGELVPDLVECEARARWLSCEPLLEEVHEQLRTVLEQGQVHWVVVGGESGPQARAFDVRWARCIIRECRKWEVPVYMKQLGSNPVENGIFLPRGERKKGDDMSVWPSDLRVQEHLPEPSHLLRSAHLQPDRT